MQVHTSVCTPLARRLWLCMVLGLHIRNLLSLFCPPLVQCLSESVSYSICWYPQVMLPCNLTAGILYLEVQRGSFMGPALPLLVAPTAALAAEAVSMLQATLPSHQQGLTVDLGCAMLRLSPSNKLARYDGDLWLRFSLL